LAEPLSEKVLAQIGKAEELYHPLVLIAAPSGSGKTTAMQDVATRTGAPQITRRMAEKWGERGTVIRTVRQVVRSFVLWDVLRETDERGVYSSMPRIEIANGDRAGPWLVEAGISNSEMQAHPLRHLVGAASFFPLKLNLSPREVGNSPRLELYRQGLDEDVVMLKGTS